MFAPQLDKERSDNDIHLKGSGCQSCEVYFKKELVQSILFWIIFYDSGASPMSELTDFNLIKKHR